MLTLEQVKNKIQDDLNALVDTLGLVDDKGFPKVYFHGEVSTYDDYSWLKSVSLQNPEEKYKMVPLAFALIRETSSAASGELLLERLDEYSVFLYVKSSDVVSVRLLLETYIETENYEDNLTTYSTVKILKRLSNFSIDEEELVGAPDGEGRHQFDLTVTYDMFESRVLTSKDYDVTIDGEALSYISFRFEKGNMIVPTRPNSPGGYSISGIDVSNNMGALHDFSLTFELYMDSQSTVIKKLSADSTGLSTVNRSFNISIKNKGTEEVFNFTHTMVANGYKLAVTLPQVSSIEVTFSMAYSRLQLKMAVGEGELELITALSGRIGSASALKTATYSGDNAAKSLIVGVAKGMSIVMPMVQGNALTSSIVEEVIKKVYTNKYRLEVTYLTFTYTYLLVISEGSIAFENAAYDTLHLNFMEAK